MYGLASVSTITSIISVIIDSQCHRIPWHYEYGSNDYFGHDDQYVAESFDYQGDGIWCHDLCKSDNLNFFTE